MTVFRTFWKLVRKHKGMTIEKAEELMKDPVFFGMMMVKKEKADGLVSGAAHSTADTLRPALQILKTAQGTKLVSTFCVIVVPNCEYGEDGVFVFADCGLNQNPNSEELSEIAISTAKSFKQILEKEPKVAMLSYSTKGMSLSSIFSPKPADKGISYRWIIRFFGLAIISNSSFVRMSAIHF